MPEAAARTEYVEELNNLEAAAFGGLDLVNAALARTLEARYGFELRADHFGLPGRCAHCRVRRGGRPRGRSGS